MSDASIDTARPIIRMCEHLRVLDAEAGDVPARSAPDPANRCLALADPIRLSPDQQRLVCSTERHLGCRRFALAATGAVPTIAAPVRSLLVRPAIIGSLVLVVVAVALTVGYLLNGGSLVIS